MYVFDVHVCTYLQSLLLCYEFIKYVSIYLFMSCSNGQFSLPKFVYVFNKIILTCMYVCLYVCMYVCVYVCMYVCVYVCIYVCMCLSSNSKQLAVVFHTGKMYLVWFYEIEKTWSRMMRPFQVSWCSCYLLSHSYSLLVGNLLHIQVTFCLWVN